MFIYNLAMLQTLKFILCLRTHQGTQEYLVSLLKTDCALCNLADGHHSTWRAYISSVILEVRNTQEECSEQQNRSRVLQRRERGWEL